MIFLTDLILLSIKLIQQKECSFYAGYKYLNPYRYQLQHTMIYRQP